MKPRFSKLNQSFKKSDEWQEAGKKVLGRLKNNQPSNHCGANTQIVPLVVPIVPITVRLAVVDVAIVRVELVRP